MHKHTGCTDRKLMFKRLSGRGWRKAALFMAIVIMFTTTYALVMPGMALDGDTASDAPGFEVATAIPQPAEAPKPTETPKPEPVVVTVTAAPVATEVPVATPAPAAPALVVTEAPAAPAEPESTEPAAPAEPVEQAEPAAAPTAPPAEATPAPAAPAATATPEPTAAPYPAVTLQKVLNERFYIEVKAPKGALPEGAKLEFKYAEEDEFKDETAVRNILGESMRSIRLFELYFTDAGGTRIQPLAKVRVSLKCEDLLEAKDDARLYYLDINHNAEFIKLLREVTKDNEITFEYKKFNRIALTFVAPAEGEDLSALTEEPEAVYEEEAEEPAAPAELENKEEPASSEEPAAPGEPETTEGPAGNDAPVVPFADAPENAVAPENTAAPGEPTEAPVQLETPAQSSMPAAPVPPAETTEEPAGIDAQIVPSSDESGTTDAPETTDEPGINEEAEVTEVPEDYESNGVADAMQELIDQITEAAETEEAVPVQTFEETSNGVKLTVAAPGGALPAGTTMQVEALGSEELIAAVESALPYNVKLFKSFRLRFTSEEQPVVPASALTVTAEGEFIGEAGFVAVLGHDADLNTGIITGAAVSEENALITFEVDADSFTIAQTNEPAGFEYVPEETQEPGEDEEVPTVTGLSFEAESNGMLLTVFVPEGVLPEDAILQVDALDSEELITAVENTLPGNVRLFRSYKLKFLSGKEEVDPGCLLTVTAKGEMISETRNVAVLRHDVALNTRVIFAAEIGEECDTATFEVRGGFFTIAQTNTLTEVNEIQTEEAVSMPEQTFNEEADGMVVDVLAPEGAFPEGTVMSVEIVTADEILDSIRSAVEENQAAESRITAIKAVDITFFDAAGFEIQPLVPIRVSIVDTMIEAAESVDIFHVDAENNTTVVDQTEEETAENEVAFDADRFSVYVLVGTESLTARVITAVGETYTIEVAYGPEAGIPKGAVLEASEIDENSEDYKEYLSKSLSAVKDDENTEISSARFFDVRIVMNGVTIEPKTGVDIKITYDDPISVEIGDHVKQVHFASSGTEVIDVEVSKNDDGEITEICFTQDSFSITGTIVTTGGSGWPTDTGYYALIVKAADESKYYAVSNTGTLTEVTYDASSGEVSFIDISKTDDLIDYEWEYTYSDGNRCLSNGDIYIDPSDANGISTTQRDLSISNDHLTVTIGNQPQTTYYLTANGGTLMIGGDSSISNEKTATVFFASQFSADGNGGGGSPSGGEDEDLGAPSIEKKLEPLNDGTYTLTLSVTGRSKAQHERTKADITIVFDRSGSMQSEGTSTDYIGYGPGRRDYDAILATKGLISALLENNTAQYPDTVEISLIQYNNVARLVRSHSTDETQLHNDVDGLTAQDYTGTNWEAAFQQANRITPRDDAVQYIIFVSDGNPTLYLTDAGNNDYIGTQDGYDIYGTGWEDATNVRRSYDNAKDDARNIVLNGANFYTLAVFDSVDRMSNVTAFAYSGNDIGTYPEGHYQTADDLDSLNRAFDKIISDINKNFSFTDVIIDDGITDMTATAVVMGVADNFAYERSGGDYGTGQAWDPPQNQQATFTNGRVNWSLGQDFKLEDGVTYTVSFRVWPSQEAYDLVADLNNGVKKYSELTDEEKYQIQGSEGAYSLKTNTDDSKVYYRQITTINGVDSEPSEQKSVSFENPPPVSLARNKMNVRKAFANDINAQHVYSQIEFYLLVEGKYYQDDGSLSETLDNSKVFKLPINADNDWTNSVFIAPGLMSDGEVLETGHNYSLDEKILVGNEYEYGFTPQKVRPMVINGTLKYLVLVDKYNPAPEGAETYYIDDAAGTYRAAESADTENVYYAAAGENDGTLVGTNRKTAELDITKHIVDNTGNLTPAQLDAETFTYRVTLTVPADANISGITAYEYVARWGEDPSDTRYTIFGYQYSEEENLRGFSDDVDRFSGKIYGGYTVTHPGGGNTLAHVFTENADGTKTATLDITLKRNEIIRFTNLPADTQYRIVEMYNDYRQADPSRNVDAPGSDMESNIADRGYSTSYATRSRNPVTNEIREGSDSGTTVEGTVDYLDVRYYNLFTNTLNEVIDVELTGTKHLDGYEWSGERYWFNLSAEDDAPLPVTGASGRVRFYLTEESGSVDKSYSFGKIRFSEAGTYTYTITEDGAGERKIVNGNVVEYGAAEAITIVIAENDGKLSVQSVANESGNTTWDAENLVANTTITNTALTATITADKAWKNADGSTTAPDGASVIFTLYEDGKATETTVKLNGIRDEEEAAASGGTWVIPENGAYESEAWVATFSGLQMYKIADGETETINYTIGETGKWAGYDLVIPEGAAEPYTVASGGTITNEQQSQWVQFRKTDMSKKTALPGAVFSFGFGSEPFTLTSGEDGIMATASGDDMWELPVQADPYTLQETAAPPGFNRLTSDVTVSVKPASDEPSEKPVTAWCGNTQLDVSGSGTQDDPYVVTITNNPGTELPMTGGEGTMRYTAAGAMLILTALCFGCARRGREKRFDF